MKILFFIESLRQGGKERRLVELLLGLKNCKNFSMELILTRKQIHFERVRELEIRIHIIERRKWQKDPLLFYNFFKLTKSIKPDIIHVWGNMAALYAIPTKFLFRIPMINNQIGDAPEQLSKGLLSYKSSFPFSDVIIANSKAGLKAYKAPNYKSKVIYNGFDFKRLNNLVDQVEIRQNFAIKTTSVIGMVASFSKYKDYQTYIEAALIVLEKFEDVTFLCIGAGEKTKYQELVPNKYHQNFRFIDAQKNVLSLMNICSVGVLSTFTEGISNAIMEFMALGKPVIATNGGGTKELLIDGLTGYLVSKKDVRELSSRMLELLTNIHLQRIMGNEGKERIYKEFNISKMVDLFKNEYKSLLTNKN